LTAFKFFSVNYVQPKLFHKTGTWGRQAAWVREVVAGIDGLEELAEIDMADEAGVGLVYALNGLRSELGSML
jgi:hypothetical protein